MTRHGGNLALTTGKIVLGGVGTGYSYFFGGPPGGIDPARSSEGGVYTGLGRSPELRNANLRILEHLADNMGMARSAGGGNEAIPAGYTYLGQLIAHDLTFNPARLPAGLQKPDQLGNLATAGLDLDCLYGGGPEKSPHLYRAETERGRDGLEARRKWLRIGWTRPRNPNSGDDLARISRDDLARVCPVAEDANLAGEPSRSPCIRETLLADPRNEDNLILSQLVVLFIKFHNILVRRLLAVGGRMRPGEIFDVARAIVGSVYRRIVCEDYLELILDKEIYEAYGKKKRPSDFKFMGARNRKGVPGAIPVEFSVAAFRFGHAMVQNSYMFNGEPRGKTGIDELSSFQNDAFDVRRWPLDNTWVIDWKRFFPRFEREGRHRSRVYEPAGYNMSALLVPHAADHLTSVSFLPGSDHRHPTAVLGGLLYRDFARAFDMALPNGQYAAHMLRTVGKLTSVKPLTKDELLEGTPQFPIGLAMPDPRNRLLERDELSGKRFADLMAEDTPLLFYVLQEAMVRNRGQKLGAVGSALIAEVIMYEIVAATDVPARDLEPIMVDIFSDRSEPADIPSTMPSLVEFVDRNWF